MEIILKIYRYPGNLMFAAVRVFNEGTRMGTIKNIKGGRFLRNQKFLETLTHMREPSCSDLRLVRALLRSRVSL